MCYLPVSTSLYWHTIYIQMDIGHLSVVATALPWLFKRVLLEVFYICRELYMNLSKAGASADVHVWTRVGQDIHMPGMVSGYQRLSILGFSG